MKIVWIFLLLLWLALGTWWSNKTFCGDKGKAKPAASAAAGAAAAKGATCDYSLIFNDGDALNITSKENFNFGREASLFKNNKVSDKLVTVLQRVAGYLEENPDRVLQITGHYHKKEGAPQKFENLGIARSTRIKQYLVKELGVAEDQLIVSSETLLSTCFTKDRVLKKGATMTFGEKK